jgi:uncharacterized protein (DUF433 family)
MRLPVLGAAVRHALLVCHPVIKRAAGAYYRCMVDAGLHVDDQLIAFTRGRAAEVAGLSVRQVMHWDWTLVAQPSITRRVSQGKVVRLYAFPELMSLLVAAELRKSGIPLAHVRQVVAHLNARGYASPLTQLVFATVGKEIYFQHEDGTWESRVRPDQVVIRQVLKLDRIRSRIRQANTRDEAAVGHVERRRGTLGGKPVIAGTRIPVATVERYLTDGCTPAEIVTYFPVLRVEDVEAVRRQMVA